MSLDADADRPNPSPAQERGVQRWLALAVGSLLAAGLLSLMLVIARVPPFNSLFNDPTLFRRLLVVHVNLALVVWFYAGLAALFHLLPTSAPGPRLARWGVWIAGAGVLALMITMIFPEATPVLSNYVPMLDHPLFAAGLGAVAAGILLSLIGPRLLPGRELPGDLELLPAAARPGLRVAAVAFLLGVLTCLSALWGTPRSLDPKAYYELLFWGGGHVLQFANAATMLCVWLILVRGLTGAEPLRRGHSALLFGLLLVPLFPAPILAAMDTTTGTYRILFTRLMELGIFPVTLVILGACIRALYKAPAAESRWRDVRFTGLVTSAGLTVLGFILGASIHGSNTLVPAHYHASLGGVTVALMTITFVLLTRTTAAQPKGWRRWIPYQPLLYGTGQAVFALGFALAGTQGMGRKTYGAEQQVRGTLEALGLGVMGLGGVVAVLGGLIFLATVISIWRSARRNAPSSTWRSTWETRAPANLPFKG